jgi:hypothetical protein
VPRPFVWLCIFTVTLIQLFFGAFIHQAAMESIKGGSDDKKDDKKDEDKK